MAEVTDQDIEANARLLLDESRWRRDDQRQRRAALNQRMGTLFALNFAVLAILGASIRIGVGDVPGYVEYFGHATLFMLIQNMCLLLWAYRVERVSHRPRLGTLRELVNQESNSTLTIWMAEEIATALDRNERRLSNLAAWTRAAMASSVVTLLMVATLSALVVWLA